MERIAFEHLQRLLLVLGLAALGSAQDDRSGASIPKADLVLHSGQVHTMDDDRNVHSALAISSGRVVATGELTDLKTWIGPETRTVDLNGRTVIPGLIDSHLHAVRGGRFFNLELRWEGVPTLREALDMLREQAARTPKGQWVRVIGGWSPFQFAERRMPTVEELNEAAPDTPVFVLFLYSQGLLNDAGLRALGLTSETEAPNGTRYELDARGHLTGRLLAEPSPVILYQTIGKLPQLSVEDRLNSTRQYYRELNRLGLTGAVDAGGGGHQFPDDYGATQQMADAGELPIRISYYLFPQRPGREFQDFRGWIENDEATVERRGYTLRGGGEFLVWAAGDYENFLAERPILQRAMDKQLEAVASLLVRERWPFRIHATYGESIGRILDVFEGLNQRVPFDGVRWAIDHAETIQPAQIERVRSLGGGIAIQDRMAFAGEYFLERYGPAVTAVAPPLRELFDSGVPLGAGTDATRVSSYDPWVSLSWMVTGETVGGTVLYPESNRLTRDEALSLFTRGSAWFAGAEDRLGVLEPGRLADLAVLSEDYFTAPAAHIAGIESVLTVVGGRIVHGSEEFTVLAPPMPAVSPSWSPVARFGGAWKRGRPSGRLSRTY
ncbi:MAG: amidohydrolase [Planctomycetota bacterium]